MTTFTEKEKEAIIRMMVYIKYELVRFELNEEAKKIDEIINNIENPLDDTER